MYMGFFDPTIAVLTGDYQAAFIDRSGWGMSADAIARMDAMKGLAGTAPRMRRGRGEGAGQTPVESPPDPIGAPVELLEAVGDMPSFDGE